MANPPVSATTSEMMMANETYSCSTLSQTSLELSMRFSCLYSRRGFLYSFIGLRNSREGKVFQNGIAQLETVRSVFLTQVGSELNLSSGEGFLEFLASIKALSLYLFIWPLNIGGKLLWICKEMGWSASRSGWLDVLWSCVVRENIISIFFWALRTWEEARKVFQLFTLSLLNKLFGKQRERERDSVPLGWFTPLMPSKAVGQCRGKN